MNKWGIESEMNNDIVLNLDMNTELKKRLFICKSFCPWNGLVRASCSNELMKKFRLANASQEFEALKWTDLSFIFDLMFKKSS